ncbi:MarR family transcriptional regulator [Mesorhizobium sp. CAU 1741]|uniref:MarR family winged helix-turn-helix transcriptional regulator n=1 Tax=Mesorhizobium sp. CAU 1741 TaxID=3140366 RepID=UPI00325AF5C8
MSRRDDAILARAALRPRTMYLLNQANQAVRMQIEQDLRPLGLTGIQYTVLSIVGTRDGISSAELSRRFFVTPQTMNEIVSALEKRGLLAREQSARSKRILTATLTDAGREILVEADLVADRIEANAFRHLSDRDFDELRRVLGGLLVALRKDGLAKA